MHRTHNASSPRAVTSNRQLARIAIVRTRWNEDLVDCMEEDARSYLYTRGVGPERIDALRVAGAFELPQAAAAAARAAADGRCALNAIIALGVVIRGETPHFQFVADACARGLGRVALDCGLPVAFGVLTTENRAQAEQRVAFFRSEPKTPLVGAARRRLAPRGTKKHFALEKDMSYERYAIDCLQGRADAQPARRSKGWEAAEAALGLLSLELGDSAEPLYPR